jgi:hypothetical protein
MAPVSCMTMLVSPTVESLSAPKTCLHRRASDRDGAAFELHADARRATSVGNAGTIHVAHVVDAQSRTPASRSAARDHSRGTAGPAACNARTKAVGRSRRRPSQRRGRSFSGRRRRHGRHPHSVALLLGGARQQGSGCNPGLAHSRLGDRYPARSCAIKLSAIELVKDSGHTPPSSPESRAFPCSSTPAEHDAFACLFRLYGLWGLGKDAIPFSKDEAVVPAAIVAVRN